MTSHDYVWPCPSGDGWVDAWNGWYPTWEQAREEGAAGVGQPWVLAFGEGIVDENEAARRRRRTEAERTLGLHYEWRVRITAPDGKETLEVPFNDPYVYEHPADGTFDSIDAALAYRDEWFADNDNENGDDWVLMFVTSAEVVL